MGKTKKKKSNKKRLLKGLLVAVIVAIVLITATFLLLKVKSFRVEGDIPYNNEEVIVASGVPLGKSMFTLDLQEIKENIETQLPYMDNVKITKRIPFTLVIKAETAKQVYSVMLTQGLYAITNEKTKILEVSSVIPEGTIMVEGTLGSFNYQLGTNAEFVCDDGADKIRDALSEISGAIDKTEFSEIQYINVTDYKNIYIIYSDRIIIKLGSTEDLEQKLSLAKKSLDEENKLSSSQYGELDVSAVSKAIFAPKDYKDMETLVEYDENMAEIEEKILDTEEADEETEDTEETEDGEEAETDEESSEEATTEAETESSDSGDEQ